MQPPVRSFLPLHRPREKENTRAHTHAREHDKRTTIHSTVVDETTGKEEEETLSVLEGRASERTIPTSLGKDKDQRRPLRVTSHSVTHANEEEKDIYADLEKKKHIIKMKKGHV